VSGEVFLDVAKDLIFDLWIINLSERIKQEQKCGIVDARLEWIGLTALPRENVL